MELKNPKSKKGRPALYVVIALAVIAVAVLALDARLYSGIVRMDPARVVLYSAPVGMQGAQDRVVTVEGSPVFVYDTAVNLNRAWMADPKLEKTPVAYFDFSGKVKVTVKAPGMKIHSVTIRPLSLGIKPEIAGDTITFSLDKPAKLTLEINNDIHRALHLFASAPEVNPPKKGDPDVLYFGPGVHRADAIELKSSQTVYIAGGAVVYGWIHGNSVENARILGRGIIDGSVYDRWKNTVVPINLERCKNCEIDGITILDPAAWTLNTLFCENIKINNVKIIGARSNSDGITMQSCKNLTATDCFVRSWDDSLVVKGYDGDVKGITFDNIVIWTDLAQSCEIGYETRAKTIEDIYFKNITVLHNFHKPVMSIHNSDNAMVRNVHYENVTVEDAQMGTGDGTNYLIDMLVKDSQWSQTPERGNIRDVYYDNIRVLSGKLAISRIQAYDEAHTIENVHINNLEIYGKKIMNAKDGKFYIDEYDAKNIEFTAK